MLDMRDTTAKKEIEREAWRIDEKEPKFISKIFVNKASFEEASTPLKRYATTSESFYNSNRDTADKKEYYRDGARNLLREKSFAPYQEANNIQKLNPFDQFQNKYAFEEDMRK